MRRREIDWIRNICILMLFIYHTAVLFTDFGDFYIKAERSNLFSNIFILLTFSWYMPLLFFLAGASTYFALQKHFIEAQRPVPRFMFLDQPSQVYFPSALDEKKTDWERVTEIYQFILDRVQQSNGSLQVIIVDHANPEELGFKGVVVENWQDDGYLVPKDWYKSSGD